MLVFARKSSGERTSVIASDEEATLLLMEERLPPMLSVIAGIVDLTGTWSKGKAICAAGVQFAQVHLNGHAFLPGQANNLYIFKAVGMAIFATQATRVTDEMFIEAAAGVADQVQPELLKQGLLYPLQADILETEIQTAARVAKLGFGSGLARVPRPADMISFIRSHVYKPEYSALTISKAARAA